MHPNGWRYGYVCLPAACQFATNFQRHINYTACCTLLKIRIMISIHDFKTSKLKRYYGASKRVYRQHHVDELLRMWKDLNYLTECSTRTRLVPANEEFLQKKAIPIYNDVLKKMQVKYPNINEFHNFKPR